MRHSRRPFAALLLGALLLVAASPAAARQPAPPRAPAVPKASAPPTAPSPAIAQSANETANELQQILNDYPPALRQVIALDPTLLDRQDYLAPYPRLAAFVQQHPEIQHNPSFFLGRGPVLRERDPRSQGIEAMEEVLLGAAIFTGIMLALWMVISLLRQLIEYRRWLRQSRVQAEANAKVFDRLTAAQDLLAYLQTPAGMSLVQVTPLLESPRPGAPIGRILWSVQAGVVLAALGIGLRVVQGRVVEDIAPAFVVAGTVAMCVGIGFVVSAVIAWVLMWRTDLFAVKS